MCLDLLLASGEADLPTHQEKQTYSKGPKPLGATFSNPISTLKGVHTSGPPSLVGRGWGGKRSALGLVSKQTG